MTSITHLYKAIVLMLVGIVLLLTAWGAYHQFSPVPFWDMWNGYVGFFQQIDQGNTSAWWAPHNEHRIILTRVIFWLNFTLFGGIQPPLIVLNFLLMGLAFWTFYGFLKRTVTPINRTAVFGAGGLILALCFFWSQSENINWGFQSQFYLAQLLPLLALLWYCISIQDSKPTYFLLSTIAGIASVGTMANGIIILPIMVLYGLVQRQPLWKPFLHAALAGILAYLYFDKSAAGSAEHAGLVHTFIAQPSDFIQYALRYLGNPFYFAALGASWGIGLAVAAGAGLIIASAVLMLYYLRSPKTHSLELALLSFVLYIGGTAIGTAGGRLNLGLWQAFSNRYSTPAIMAWCALIILLCSFLKKPITNRLFSGLVLIALLLLLPFQMSARSDNAPEKSKKLVAALALDMRINDEPQLKTIFPSPDLVMNISQWAIAHKTSIFNEKPIKDTGHMIGHTVQRPTEHMCAYQANNISVTEVNSEYARVSALIEAEPTLTGEQRLLFTDEANTVVGAVIAQRSNFAGYIKRSALGKQLLLTGEDNACGIRIELPKLYFSSLPFAPAKAGEIAVAHVQADAIWAEGSDSWHSTIDGLKVYGSWKSSDADRGTITLDLNKGDSILYRSGPINTRQIIKVDGTGAANLPVTLEWTTLKFDAPDLPARFKVSISDEGDGWGEWSAVAVKAAQ
jgi:hypothetical protein